MIFDAERTEGEMRRHRVYRRKRGKIYAASRLDHCTNGDPMFVILIIVTIVIVVIVPCIRWLRERACWNEGFAGITIDCSLCSCSSVSLSLSLSFPTCLFCFCIRVPTSIHVNVFVHIHTHDTLPT